MTSSRLALALACLLAIPSFARAQSPDIPRLAPIVARPESDLAPVVERYTADQNSIDRRYDVNDSPLQRKRERDFVTGWQARLREVDFDRLNLEGKADYVLLQGHLKYQVALLDRREEQRSEMASVVPFADNLLALQDQRRSMTPVNPTASARTLAQVMQQVDSLRALFEPSPVARPNPGNTGTPDTATMKPGVTPPKASAPKISKTVANRAALNIDAVKNQLQRWYRYYDGYDPMFSWWVKSPYARLDSSLTRYARTLRERVAGFTAAQLNAARPSPNDAPIIGDPIGADGLKADLEHEMIPYTPEELIAIAQHEYAFSLSEMKKAAREMGFGDDWKAAMEKVKESYVEPGKQTELIRQLAREAEGYFDAHDWVTIPPLAKEDWRMEMLSADDQKASPFFLGGESILVAYPTADMTDEDKLMSLRGNNPHFSRAVVFHELNPGHHLQQFMQARYNQHRRIFGTPFWNEGQSLYWEMFLYDHGFQATPEDRVGALFWRMHRSARIIFSLNFHLGKMTPEQAVQFLVDTVNFERANAEGEVRRSFSGAYSPLYQSGYMLGGLELRALHHELVDAGKMTDRQYHDAVLEGGAMPIAMIRARLRKLSFAREGPAPWRFADELPPPIPYVKK
ncbi:MAG: hypothetical protein JWO05_761 [Gemmatimonadetes bacterium]|nr:hypothetical protein [Gemmatimonadota bacterium]